MTIEIEPIGYCVSPFETVECVPIQPLAAQGIRGTLVVFDAYAEGLKDLDGFSHIIVLYQFHRVKTPALRVVPFMDTMEHGIFATRSPKRPNRIGLSTLKLLAVHGNEIEVEGVDLLNQTPIIDIKPYFPKFDTILDARGGWLDKQTISAFTELKSDARFCE